MQAIVFAYLLIVAATNLAIGYGLALLVQRDRASSPPATGHPPLVPAHDPAPQPESSRPMTAPEAAIQVTELAPEWQEAMQDAGEVRSFVEAAVHLLRLEASRYRERLIEVDSLLRRCLAEPQSEMLVVCLGNLQEANESWLRKQSDTADALQARRGQFGELAAWGNGLEEMLMEQAAQIETTCSNIEMLDLRTDVRAGAGRLVTEVGKLLELCHRLRDRMQELLVGIFAQGRRLAELDPERLIDPLMSIYNRLGLERMLYQWWRDDPTHSRQATFALLDIDRTGRINEQFGPKIADQVIRHVGRLFGEVLRRNRGFDVAGRLSGQTFAAFLGDTGPNGATAAVERVRQSIQAHRFVLGDEVVEVLVTCGLIEVGKKDTSATLLQRAQQTLREAKRAGRNLTLLQAGADATVIEPPVCHVTPGEVVLEA